LVRKGSIKGKRTTTDEAVTIRPAPRKEPETPRGKGGQGEGGEYYLKLPRVTLSTFSGVGKGGETVWPKSDKRRKKQIIGGRGRNSRSHMSNAKALTSTGRKNRKIGCRKVSNRTMCVGRRERMKRGKKKNTRNILPRHWE